MIVPYTKYFLVPTRPGFQSSQVELWCQQTPCHWLVKEWRYWMSYETDSFTRIIPAIFFILAMREMATHNARHLLWPSSFTLSMTKSHRPSSRYTITSMSSTVWCVCVSYKWDHRPFYSAFQKLTTLSCNYRQTIATLCYSNSCMFLLRFHTVNIVWHRTLSTGPGENWSFTQKHW